MFQSTLATLQLPKSRPACGASLILIALAVLMIPLGATAQAGLAEGESKPEDSTASDGAFNGAFAGPYRYQFDSYPQMLTVADFNGDGLSDFVVSEQGRGLINIGYSAKKAPEDANKLLQLDEDAPEGWEIEQIVFTDKIWSFAAADVDGDGLTDLLAGTDQKNLEIFYQRDGRLRNESEQLDGEAQYVLAADLDGNGAHDLIATADQTLTVWLQDDDGKLKRQTPTNLFAKPRRKPLLVDVNSDGALDLVYTDSSDSKKILWKAGQKGGSFGPERMVDVDDHYDLVAATENRLAYLEQRTRALRAAALQPKEAAAKSEGDLPFGDALLFPLPEELRSGDRELVTTPGLDSSVAAFSFSEAADLFFLTHDAGAFSLKSIPAPPDLQSLALIKQDDKSELLMLSEEEKQLFRLALGGDALPNSYPASLALPEAPLATALVQGNDKSAVFAPYHPDGDEDEMLRLYALNWSEKIEFIEDEEGFELNDTEEYEPNGAVAGDLNNDTKGDLLLFFRYEEPLVFEISGDGSDGYSAVEANGLNGVFSDLNPASLHVGDVSGDGQNEIVIARERFLRVLRFDENWEPQVLAQLNAPKRSAKLEKVLAFDANGDGRLDLATIDGANDQLVVFIAEEGELSSSNGAALQFAEEAELIDLPDLNVSRVAASDFNGDGATDVLLLAEDAIALLLNGRTELELATLDTRLTDVDDGLYGRLYASSTGGAPSHLYAVEAREHLLEFLTIDEDDTLQSVYGFRVYNEPRSLDDNQIRRRTTEPHDLERADFNGDGLLDIIILAHDNVIIYTANDDQY